MTYKYVPAYQGDTQSYVDIEGIPVRVLKSEKYPGKWCVYSMGFVIKDGLDKYPDTEELKNYIKKSKATRKIASAFSPGARFIYAIISILGGYPEAAKRELAAEMRRKLTEYGHEQIAADLDKIAKEKGRQYFDYDGLLDKVFSQLGVKKVKQDDYRQEFYLKIFGAGEKDFFTKFDPTNYGFTGYFMGNAQRLFVDLFRKEQTEERYLPKDKPKRDDDTDEKENYRWDQIHSLKDLGDEIVMQDLVSKIDEYLDSDGRFKTLKLRQIFDLLLEGYTKGEVAQQIGVQQSNFTRRLKELRDQILFFAKQEKLPLLKALINKELGSIPSEPQQSVASKLNISEVLNQIAVELGSYEEVE